MDCNEVYKIIAPSHSNLIKIAKAVRRDFEAEMGYYQIFERKSVKESLILISKEIADEYKDKEELWNKLELEFE
ncbi:hypothetical protein Q604_UNBC09997G0002 [human gut metagenome]|uniref:Uncharacterized protein n=1 Tax=human gut metagenome TaxID=408170 RepID=W1XZQ1_9ZZZZ